MLRPLRNFSSTHRQASKELMDGHFRSSSSLKKNQPTPAIPRRSSSSIVNGKLKEQVRVQSSLKEVVDNYFKQQANSEHKMPLIQAKRASFKYASDRRSRYFNKAEEGLSKSMNLQVQDKMSPLPPPPGLRQKEQLLPSIHEQAQDQQEKEQAQLLMATSNSFLNRASSILTNFSNPQGQGQQKICTFENELFYIFTVKKQGRPIARVKQYKESGLGVMQRELKMRNYQIKTLWKESKYNQYSFAMKFIPPIKDLILKIIPDQASPSQLKIKPTHIHSKLIANHCQQLSMMLRNICLQLKNIEGKVLNNKINSSNIFLLSNGAYLGDWGYSSFRDEFLIRENRFEKRLYGILKGENDWFVSPEYLAPEIIRQFLGEDQEDIWMDKGSPDVWSLGITFFEILTLIPVWISSKCSLITRPSILRRGVLYSPDRQLQFLLKKQGEVQRVMRRLLYSQIGAEQQNQKLFQVILRMVEVNTSKRISLDQIIQLL